LTSQSPMEGKSSRSGRRIFAPSRSLFAVNEDGSPHNPSFLAKHYPRMSPYDNERKRDDISHSQECNSRRRQATDDTIDCKAAFMIATLGVDIDIVLYHEGD